MTTASNAWEAPALALVHAAQPGPETLFAGLRALRAVCNATIALAPRVDGFDPASGWQTADGTLGLLELHLPDTAEPDLELPPPPDLATAAAAVDRLMRVAAGAALTACEMLRGPGNTQQLLALASVTRELAAGYQRTFGRAW